MKQWKRRNVTHPWQQMVDDKFLAFAFAHANGVRTPRLLACSDSGTSELPSKWPASWGGEFVVKPHRGWSSSGVLLIRDGVDQKFHKVGGAADVLKVWRQSGLPAFMKTGPTIVEQLIRPPAGLPSPNDYKFFTFGGHVAAVWVIIGRNTPGHCAAFYDAEWRHRLDGGGCVCDSTSSKCPQPETERYRTFAGAFSQVCKTMPRPRGYTAALQSARTLGRALGAPYRIDFFINPEGEHVLGELTAFHTSGFTHCVVAPPREGKPRDACALGRAWRRQEEGNGAVYSDLTPPPLLLEAQRVQQANGSVGVCKLLQRQKPIPPPSPPASLSSLRSLLLE